MTSVAKLCFLLAITATAAGHAAAGEADDVASAATAFFNAQNAHDIRTVSSFMVNSEDFLLIRGPMMLWGTMPR